jgi:hypothetical protein
MFCNEAKVFSRFFVNSGARLTAILPTIPTAARPRPKITAVDYLINRN